MGKAKEISTKANDTAKAKLADVTARRQSKASARPEAPFQRRSGATYNIQKIPGYPNRLEIYERGDSKFIQVRVLSSGRYKRKSTGTDNRKAAIEFAKKFYDEISAAERNDVTIFPTSFGSIAKQYLEAQEKLKDHKRINDRKFVEEKKSSIRTLSHILASWRSRRSAPSILTII